MADFSDKKSGGILGGNDEEFQEEEVWAVGKGSRKGLLSMMDFESSPPPPPTTTTTTPMIRRTSPRVIPRGGRRKPQTRFSTSLIIPDWNKKLGWPIRSCCTIGPAYIYDNQNKNGVDHPEQNVEEEAAAEEEEVEAVAMEVDEENEELLPPHEIIARRNARNPSLCRSMCRGRGRTLKGRDLCQVRNAILAKTGVLD